MESNYRQLLCYYVILLGYIMSLPADAIGQLDRQLPRLLQDVWSSLLSIFQCLASASTREEGGGEAASGRWHDWRWMSEQERGGSLIYSSFFPWLPLWWPTYCTNMSATWDPKQMCGFVGGWNRVDAYKFLRRLWTDGLSDWINQGNFI